MSFFGGTYQQLKQFSVSILSGGPIVVANGATVFDTASAVALEALPQGGLLDPTQTNFAINIVATNARVGSMTLSANPVGQVGFQVGLALANNGPFLSVNVAFPNGTFAAAGTFGPFQDSRATGNGTIPNSAGTLYMAIAIQNAGTTTTTVTYANFTAKALVYGYGI